MDPGYLDSLHQHNVDFCSYRIAAIDKTGVVLENGNRIDADVIVYATGFHTQDFLSPMTIVGQEGKALNGRWKSTNGSQAYLGTAVSGFPNFGMLFGLNASPTHNSVIYALEVQAEYVIQALLEPIVTGRATSIVVKRSPEDYDCNMAQRKLEDSVWHAGCTNWAFNEHGRNCTNYPEYVRSFWWKLYWPKSQD